MRLEILLLLWILISLLCICFGRYVSGLSLTLNRLLEVRCLLRSVCNLPWLLVLLNRHLLTSQYLCTLY